VMGSEFKPQDATWFSATRLENPAGPDEDPYATVEYTWVWNAGDSSQTDGISGWEFKTLAAALEHALKWVRGE
jgi:hypothetical protein